MSHDVDASIDFLSSIPDETLRESGPYGRAYDLQLSLDRARGRLSNLRERLHEEIDNANRAAQAQGGFGLLGSAFDRIDRDPAVIAATKQVEELTETVTQAQAEVGGLVFLPAVENLPEIQKRLATLSRKAANLGTDEISLEVTDEKLLLNYKVNDEDTHGYDFEHVFVVLHGATPKIPGFEFLATVNVTEEGNIVKRIPPIRFGIQHNLEFGDRDSDDSAARRALETIDLTRYHSTGDICEHCHKDRRRMDLFVVYNAKTGETKQVGRSCLRDYTGANDPERVLKVLEQVWEFFRAARGSRGETPALTTEDFLTHVATLTRVNAGYRKGMGYDAASNYYAKLYERRDKKNRPEWVEPNGYDRQQAQELLSWIRDWDATGDEFVTNLQTALANEVMDRRFYGIAGAAYIAREKAIERKTRQVERNTREQARQEANTAKQHVGTEGKRETFTLTVKEIKWIADRYGYGDDATKPLIIMADQDGNEVKWFASNLPEISRPDIDIDAFHERHNYWPPTHRDGVPYTHPMIDGTYQVKATVKRHEDDDTYGKSTVITRAKFEKIINEPEEASDAG